MRVTRAIRGILLPLHVTYALLAPGRQPIALCALHAKLELLSHIQAERPSQHAASVWLGAGPLLALPRALDACLEPYPTWQARLSALHAPTDTTQTLLLTGRLVLCVDQEPTPQLRWGVQ